MIKFSCENEFCIYQKQGNCILDNIQLDKQGCCLDCIYIDIEENELNKFKEKPLGEL